MSDEIKINSNNIADEPRVEFKLISDRSIFNVVNKEINQTLVEISGYDLQINFNLEYLNTMEDIESAIEGLGNLFRDIILERLLAQKKQNG